MYYNPMLITQTVTRHSWSHNTDWSIM